MASDPSPTLTRRLLERIEDDPEATARLFDWLDARGVQHSGMLSAATLGAALGVHERSFRKWYHGERPPPRAAMRLLCEAAGVEWPEDLS